MKKEEKVENSDLDWRKIVEGGYMGLIKGSLNRIAVFGHDTILNNIVRLLVKIPDATSEKDINADEVLIVTDKFYLFKNMWKPILEILYEKYLPAINYEFNWTVEATPYTLTICELTKADEENDELQHLMNLASLTDDDIEHNFSKIVKDLGFDKMNLDNHLEVRLSKRTLPISNKEKLKLLFRLMNFPPLQEITLFYRRYVEKLNREHKELGAGFSTFEEVKMPKIGMSESLHYSYFQIDHEVFKKYGLKGFSKHSELKQFSNEFDQITKVAKSRKNELKDDMICPCCGKKQTINLPEELLQYKLLLENTKLAERIGLVYFDEFVEDFKTAISKRFGSFLPNLNVVNDPKIIILVEGESEEISIPILAFRRRFVLSHNEIQVYNSKSKQKLKEDFFNMRSKYPERKIICFLDSDAIKERDDINRVVQNEQNKYRMIFIEKGTFEDLFDLKYSVEILNYLYTEGVDVLVSDFDPTKDFLTNISRILYVKKKAVFDKVLFARTISLKMDIEYIPEKINEVLQIVKDFSTPSKFIKS
ncbi:hypothetical protein [Mariniflexile sp. AS56]|uniref:hypothetical protein n=1 Tax=Mariniflexile sp. AS56 TaxID=3063957 RepID=UPI0026EC94D5|nr:hypothetical protein [Mariniflexile sp. AS56]MDO7173872.1 hypothetical protein [Mariniflexile sp. AS56]